MTQDAGHVVPPEGFKTQGASLPISGAFPVSPNTGGTTPTGENMPAGPTSDVSNAQDDIPTQIPVTDPQPPALPSTESIINYASTVQDYDTTHLHSLPPDAQPSELTSVGVRRRRRGRYREDLTESFMSLPPDLQSQMRALASGLAKAEFVTENEPEPSIGSSEASTLLNVALPHWWADEAHRGKSLWTVFIGEDGHCLWCGYSRIGDLTDHVRTHFGHRPFACNQRHKHNSGRPW